MPITPPRVRFAPSPTGYLHIGGLRTLLYNYLFARKNKGVFFLRIEDTDQTRFVEGAAENLLKVISQMGLAPDEGPMLAETPIKKSPKNLLHLTEKGAFGPYIQSQRMELYQKYAQELIDKGAAYYCFCTPEELTKMREEQTLAKLAPMYDRRCLKLPTEEIQKRMDEGIPHVIRQKITRDSRIEFNDLIRGKISFHGTTIDDQILLKSDKFPTYHLANVVDDHLMETSHVIRAEEWLASTPKHIELFKAFGWNPPEYGHIPLILNADKSKLSKRQNDVSVESYLEKGYLKEAIINFIVLLGWHPGKGVEKEMFNIDELIEQFSLEGVNKSGAVFNREKLDWFNFQWQKKLLHEDLQKIAKNLDAKVEIAAIGEDDFNYTCSDKSTEEKFIHQRGQLLYEIAKNYLQDFKPEGVGKFMRALLVNEEKILKDKWHAKEHLNYFFSPKPLNKNLLLNEKMGVLDHESAKRSIEIGVHTIKAVEDFSSQEAIKSAFLKTIAESGLKNGQVLWPIRAALTSEQFSVGAFEAVWVLGKSKSLERLEQVLKS